MKNKFTPGPWVSEDNGMYSEIKPIGSNQSIASVFDNEYLFINTEVRLKNARLIAAAPELLEALQSMVNLFDRDLPAESIGKSSCNKSIEAINKAI